MNDLRSRLQTAPPVVIFVITSVVWGLGTWGFGFLNGSSSFSPTSLITRAVAAAVFGGLMTALILFRRRRAGGIDLAMGVNRAIKAGTVPPDADAATWAPALRRREQSLARVLWLNPVVFALFSGLGVFLLVRSHGQDVIGWIALVVFVGLAVFTPVTAARQLTRVRTLQQQLPPAPGVPHAT